MKTLTRNDWFEAARTILKSRGGEHVTLREMGNHLDVSTGSFYHHFANRAAFVDALFTDWAEEAKRFTEEIDARNFGSPRELNRQVNASIDHRLEAAMRSWALFDGRVAQRVVEFDAARRSFIREFYRGRLKGRLARDVLDLHICALVGAQFLFQDCPADLDRVGNFVNRTAAKIVEQAD